jgi:hypothetical protein
LRRRARGRSDSPCSAKGQRGEPLLEHTRPSGGGRGSGSGSGSIFFRDSGGSAGAAAAGGKGGGLGLGLGLGGGGANNNADAFCAESLKESGLPPEFLIPFRFLTMGSPLGGGAGGCVLDARYHGAKVRREPLESR